MEDKIKIYVPESVNNILLKDMERFEFYKKDNSFNKNEFYNTLIINYYEQYNEMQSSLFENIKNTITENTKISKYDVNNIVDKILDYVDNQTNNLNEEPSSITLSIKPTKNSSSIFKLINYNLGNKTLSAYFRNMFASYTLLPQDKREKIIFKHNFELIDQAIKDRRKIFFTTTNSDQPHIASPYSICNSKEELFNYVLVNYNNSPYSFRIGRLKKINILNETSEINAQNEIIFKLMEQQGPQFSYSINKNDKIKVFLTEKGKQLYKNIYLHRPQYTNIEDNYYYFDCSYTQANQYFSRFGHHALIIEPQYLFEDLQRFYCSAAKTYNRFQKEGLLPNETKR